MSSWHVLDKQLYIKIIKLSSDYVIINLDWQATQIHSPPMFLVTETFNYLTAKY